MLDSSTREGNNCACEHQRPLRATHVGSLLESLYLSIGAQAKNNTSAESLLKPPIWGGHPNRLYSYWPNTPSPHPPDSRRRPSPDPFVVAAQARGGCGAPPAFGCKCPSSAGADRSGFPSSWRRRSMVDATAGPHLPFLRQSSRQHRSCADPPSLRHGLP